MAYSRRFLASIRRSPISKQLEFRLQRITFSTSRPGEKRKHYINQADVEVLLSRLPEELWSRLRGVHFNDRGWGARRLGYVNMGHREIAISALPPRVSMNRFFTKPSSSVAFRRQSPREFGAGRGRQWTEIAVRRFMLYEVFLHELGHLQIVLPDARRVKRRFASERKAEDFAIKWRRKLWAESFEHADPIHNRPNSNDLKLHRSDFLWDKKTARK